MLSALARLLFQWGSSDVFGPTADIAGVKNQNRVAAAEI